MTQFRASYEKRMMKRMLGAKVSGIGGKEMRFDFARSIYDNCRDIRVLVLPQHSLAEIGRQLILTEVDREAISELYIGDLLRSN